MAGHRPFSELLDKMPPDRRAESDLRVQYLRWRRHPLSGPLTRADWLVMLYGAASGVVYMHLEGLPFPANILIGAFVGFFLMLMLVIFTKVFLMWEYMRIPVMLVRAVRFLVALFLAVTIIAAAASGDWPVVAMLAWVLLPLLLLFCQPRSSV